MFHLWNVPHNNSYLEIQSQLQSALAIIMHLVDKDVGCNK